MALVFPFAMLTRMMSAGAIGGGVSSAVSRGLGALDSGRANTLAVYALVIGAAVGVVYTLIFIVCGATSYRMTGAQVPCSRKQQVTQQYFSVARCWCG